MRGLTEEEAASLRSMTSDGVDFWVPDDDVEEHARVDDELVRRGLLRFSQSWEFIPELGYDGPVNTYEPSPLAYLALRIHAAMKAGAP